jgi:adenylylsulfate kinase
MADIRDLFKRRDMDTKSDLNMTATPAAGPVIPPAVVWLTGLSGAGKTTIGRALYADLSARGVRVEFLDGDAVRDLLPGTGFTRAERDAHVKRVGFLASRLEHHDILVICALISPYREAREYSRRLCRRFVEVHVATPLEECERRDPKALYARARRGEIQNFTGVSDPYEAPLAPDVVIDTRGVSVEDAVGQILGVLGV